MCLFMHVRERENIYIQRIDFNAESTMRVFLCTRCQHLSTNKHLKLNLLKSRNREQSFMPDGLLSCTTKYAQTLLVLRSIPSLKFAFNNNLFFFPLPVSVDFQSTVNLTKLNNINTAARYELEEYAGPFLPDAVTTVDAKVGQAGSAKYVLPQLSSGFVLLFFFSVCISSFLSWRKFGLSFLGEAHELQEQCYPFIIIMYIYHAVINALSAHIIHAFYQCVQYFYLCKQWQSCQLFTFLTCTQMLMRAIACRVCTNASESLH